MKETEILHSEARLWGFWVNWERKIVSFHPVQGYETMQFDSEDAWMAMTLILATRVFRFQ